MSAPDLETEIAYARAYLDTRLSTGAVRTACIAFAGFSARDIEAFACRLGCTALNGAYDPKSDPLVFSDLEHTKGYEFDTLIIINCRDGVLPSRDGPPEEQFRETCKLYVAITRAKKELLLSFSGSASPWLRAVNQTISIAEWHNVEVINDSLLVGTPDSLPEIDPSSAFHEVGLLNGLQYVFTSYAIGLSTDAQDKLIELVDGRELVPAL